LAFAAACFGAANSPVADAAMRGDTAAVRSLLAQKADVNAPQADGATAIHWAAYKNDLGMADALIAAGASVKAANREGFTALRMASIEGSAAMISKLLDAGADPNELGTGGETPLMFASRSGSLDAMRLLLDRGAQVNARETLRGTTPLMWATEQGHSEAVKLLIERGADVSAASNVASKGGTAYLAPSVQQRARSAQGSGGLPASRREEREFLGERTSGGRPGQANTASAAAPAAPRAGDGGDDGDLVARADEEALRRAFFRTENTDGGGLTPLVYAARQNCMECVKLLLEAGADVNQRTNYGWTALLTATQNKNYEIGRHLLERGADPNIKNKGGWSSLYLATDNRNIEGGDYPVRPADMDHLEFIKLLLDKGADVNTRICGEQSTAERCTGDSTETRTIFTMQWVREEGATPFWRAAQSGDVEMMKLLLAHGADPKIASAHDVTPLAMAAGIGWVEGVTFEWSPEQNLEAIRICLDAGIDPNIHDDEGRVALHGAAHKGNIEALRLLVERGADLEAHDLGSRDTVNGERRGHTWIALHYAQGLVRVGVQSAIPHPETADTIKQLMAEKGLAIPADLTNSICLTKACEGDPI
jgi:ankyrin repeat protein